MPAALMLATARHRIANAISTLHGEFGSGGILVVDATTASGKAITHILDGAVVDEAAADEIRMYTTTQTHLGLAVDHATTPRRHWFGVGGLGALVVGIVDTDDIEVVRITGDWPHIELLLNAFDERVETVIERPTDPDAPMSSGVDVGALIELLRPETPWS